MTSYLFDIDGTLTLPRQRISESFEEFFFNWMQNKKVYLVTGSDLKKVKEQLTERIINSCSGIFCSMANELYINGEKVYENKFEPPKELLQYLQSVLNNSSYNPKRTTNFEFRTGMLNFSVAGRDSSNEERLSYELWDLKNKERSAVANHINKNFPDFEARVGGQISIDIQMKEKNKSLASKWLRQNIGGRFLFFGDKTHPEGNDYDIVADIIQNDDGEIYSIKDPDQLRMILEAK